MGYYYWDPTYILVVIGAVICMIASARVKGTFNKYSQLRSMSGMNGAQVAQRVPDMLLSCEYLLNVPLINTRS